jgi:transaldolase
MQATELLHNLGQSIWLGNITRDLLNSGTLKRYVADGQKGKLQRSTNPRNYDFRFPGLRTLRF